MENEATAPSGLGAAPRQLWAWHTAGAQQANSECVKGEAAKTRPQSPRRALGEVTKLHLAQSLQLLDPGTRVPQLTFR